MENASIVLSIITVTRNCSKTILDTLQSVARVKLNNIEYVVVDGASDDGTLAILHAAGELIDTLISEPDSGIYDAMNKAVKLARGDYVLFINGDDALIQDGFVDVVSTLESNVYDIVCATTLADSHISPVEILTARPSRLLFFNSVPHPSSFVRRELLLRNPFRTDLRIASDYDFFLCQYLSRQTFKILPVVTALHHRGGASGSIEKSISEIDIVRKERLGNLYPMLNFIAAIYRYVKRVIIKFGNDR